MPKYNLKLGGRTVFSTETDEPLSKSVTRKLQGGKPQTEIDSGGTAGGYSFQGQEIDQQELREIKHIRETGGVISHLVGAKALMHFGTGVEFEVERNEELSVEDTTPKEWLHDQFNDIDNLLVDLGEDALWYPYSVAEIVETSGGGFSHVEMVEPWTMLPKTDRYGDIVMWEQDTQHNNTTKTYAADEIVSFVLNKSGGRDKTGISEVKRAEDEIMAFKKNQQAIQQAVDVAAYRRHWWKIGREGGGIIDDNELRRVRNRLNDLDGDTQIFTGRDVDHELMDAMDPKAFKSISEMDIRNVAVALGVPIELASVISEGLGSGEQSGVRMQAFLLSARANQRRLADQFIQEIVRPVLERYSPFPGDMNVEMVFGEPLSDEMQAADFVNTAGPYMTLNEKRERLDLPPEEDDELGESYRKPANVEAPEEEEPEDGGLPFFSDDSELQERHLETYDDYPEAAQENARMALDAREEHGNPNDCGTRVGWERANQLDNGEALSKETISRMAAFERHEDNKEQGEEGNKDCGWLMWKAWGGDEGIEWAQSKLDEIENADAQLSHADAVIFESDGDPFRDKQSFLNFLEALDREASVIYVGQTRYPSDDLPMHNQPIKAWGISEERARHIYDSHSGFVDKLEAPTLVDDPVSLFRQKRLSDGTPEWDEHFLELHRRTWDYEPGKNLLEFSGSQTPEMVKENIRKALLGGTLFPEIESIPSSARPQLRSFLIEQLEDENWNIDGIANRLQDLGVGLSKDRAELIARTEVAAAVNSAREDAYEERGLADDGKFYWVGTSDDRTTEACEWLKEQTNPKHGGEPVSLSELRELVKEAPTHDPEMQDNLARPENLVVHPNERHTWVRAV